MSNHKNRMAKMEREESMGGGESRDSTAGEGRMEKGGAETASCGAGEWMD